MHNYFITHFIADFILQTRTMARLKSSVLIWLLAHISIIYVSFLWAGQMFALLNATAHMIIDGTIWNVYKFMRRKEDKDTFKYWEDHLFYTVIGADQLLHILTIIWLLEIGI